MKKILIKIIETYQKTLSPDHGWLKKINPQGFCKYHPTCSEYTKQAIKTHGSLKGVFLGFWRINRCNPWSLGGVDEAEKATTKQALYGFLTLLAYIVLIFVLSFIFTKVLL